MLARVRLSLRIATTLLVAIATPVKALEVEISPPNPQLGDTISAIVTTDDPSIVPTVQVGSQTYPVFEHDGEQYPAREGRGLRSRRKYRAFVPTSPLTTPGKMTVRVQGDNKTSQIGVWLKSRNFPVQRIWLSGKASRPATPLELERVAAFKELVTPQKFWQGSFLRPNLNRVSTGFGIRRYYNNVFASDYYHKGVDYAGGYGSPIIAPAAGKVRLVGREDAGFHVHGNVVGIDHGQGVLSIFMHLQDINVAEGTMVEAGQRIGTIGSTGASTGPHLHWGLYVNQTAVDPVPWRFGTIE